MAERIGVHSVCVLIVDAHQFLGRCNKDVEQLWVKMFAPVLEHELNRMTDFKGRLVDPLRGQGIKRVGNRGNAAFDGNGLAL